MPSRRFLELRLIFVVALSVHSISPVYGADVASEQNERGRIPDEIESDGEHSLGFSHGGSAAAAGINSIRSNPAMLSFEKVYSLSAGYHWPSVGRPFYQAGIIDTKTSTTGAGVSFTSSLKNQDYVEDLKKVETQGKDAVGLDSPSKSRLSFALSQGFSTLSVGIGAQMIQSYEEDQGVTKGLTYGLGLAGLLTSELRFGLSAENFGNKNVESVAPRIYRGGLAYVVKGGDVTLHLDYKHRQRTAFEASKKAQQVGGDDASGFEKMLIPSFSIRLQNLVRFLGGYGYELGGYKRESLGLGVALVKDSMSLSFLYSKPYLSSREDHQAVNLSLLLAM